MCSMTMQLMPISERGTSRPSAVTSPSIKTYLPASISSRSVSLLFLIATGERSMPVPIIPSEHKSFEVSPPPQPMSTKLRAMVFVTTPRNASWLQKVPGGLILTSRIGSSFRATAGDRLLEQISRTRDKRIADLIRGKCGCRRHRQIGGGRDGAEQVG